MNQAPPVAMERPLRSRSALLLLSALAAAGVLGAPAAADVADADVAAVARHGATVSAANALIVEVRVSLTRAAPVYVEYDNPQAGRYRTAPSEPATEHLIPIVRLRPQTTYDYHVFTAGDRAAGDRAAGDRAAGDRAAGRDTAAARGRFTSGPLPAPLAAAPARVTGRSSQPLILSDYYHQKVASFVINDETGVVVWYSSESEKPEPFATPIDRLPGGNWIFLDSGRLTELTPLGEVVNRFERNGRWGQPHHDVTVLDDGRVIYPSKATFSFDDRANGGAVNTRFRVDHLRVWDPQSGRVEQVWDATAAWDIQDPNQRAPNHPRRREDGLIDWVSLNSVSIGPRGNAVLSFRKRNQVVSLSPDFSTIEWQLHGPDSDYRFPNPADRFYGQHTAAQLADGNILVFDNGWHRPEAEGGEYSRALELRLDDAAGTAVKVWEYRPEPDVYSHARGSAYRLRNGNTLVNFTGGPFSDGPLLIVEVDAAGAEVFRLEHLPRREPALTGYRAYGGVTSIMGETMLRPPAPRGGG